MGNQRQRIECLEGIIRDLRKADAVGEARQNIIRFVQSLATQPIGGMESTAEQKVEQIRRRANQLDAAYNAVLHGTGK